MKKMIFHHPMPLDPNATSASGIRPQKIINAFREIGYDVTVISGYGAERKKIINSLKNRIRSGEKYDFVYSESSTQPTLLTEQHHFPCFPFLDFGFLRFCKMYNIPIGLFYRDIYWIFPEYKASLPSWKGTIATFFYKHDIRQYSKLVDKFYLPSMEMAKYIPHVALSKCKALPPGHDAKPQKHSPSNQILELLYIGGLGIHYQLHEVFEALKDLPNVHFTLCTRSSEWESVKDTYPTVPNVSIVHKSGQELKKLYEKTDIAILFVKPNEYREFAAPVKLYEYIGEGKPIIASEGTLSGTFVKEHDLGWTLPYTAQDLKNLLSMLHNNPDKLIQKAIETAKISKHHLWKTRAESIVKDLTR